LHGARRHYLWLSIIVMGWQWESRPWSEPLVKIMPSSISHKWWKLSGCICLGLKSLFNSISLLQWYKFVCLYCVARFDLGPLWACPAPHILRCDIGFESACGVWGPCLCLGTSRWRRWLVVESAQGIEFEWSHRCRWGYAWRDRALWLVVDNCYELILGNPPLIRTILKLCRPPYPIVDGKYLDVFARY